MGSPITVNREMTASSKTSTPVDTQGSVPSWGNLQNGTESSKDDDAHCKDKGVRLPAMDQCPRASE